MKRIISIILMVAMFLGLSVSFANGDGVTSDWEDSATLIDEQGERTFNEDTKLRNQAKEVFSDLSGHWGLINIMKLYNEGSISGYSDGTVKPNNTVTRAEFLALASKTLYPEEIGKNETGKHWAKPYFDTALVKGILRPSEINEETWNENITRYEMARILIRFLEKVIDEESQNVLGVKGIMEDYEDVTIHKDSYYVQQAFVKGIITGKNTNGLFAGNDYGTRAEAATLIIRLIDTKSRKEVVLRPEYEIDQEDNKVDILEKKDSVYSFYDPYIEELLKDQDSVMFSFLDQPMNIDDYVSLEIPNPSLIKTLKDLKYMTNLQSIDFGSANSKSDISNLELELLNSSGRLKYMSLVNIDKASINYILENVDVESIIIKSSYILNNLNAIRSSNIKKVFIFAPVLDTKALSDMSNKVDIVFHTREDWNQSIKINDDMITRIVHAEKVTEKVKEIVSSKLNDSMDEVTKIRVLHDYLVNTISYDYDAYFSNSIEPVLGTSYGALINKSAVCSGYANAMHDLLLEAGFESYIVSGTAKGISDSYEGHAWNIVKVNGEYKNIDVTWDDPIVFDGSNRKETLRYDYFLVNDEKLSKDHKWERNDYPTCD